MKTTPGWWKKTANTAGAWLTLAGFATFAYFRAAGGLWLLPFVLFLFTFLKRPLKPWIPACRRCFFPFAAGLLIGPMRLFYWDRVEFGVRTRSLLLLAALCALYSLAHTLRWTGKFLYFFNSLSLKKRLLAIFIGAELLFILAAAVLTYRGVALAGDEPHYLAISQSLARDRDLNVFNQYFRGGYREFLDVEKLPAHGTWGKGFKKIYSYHLPGVSFTLVPFFFFKITPPLLYFLIRSYLGLFAALLAALVYLFCIRLWRSRSLALFAACVFTLTAPVFFYSFHVFPEIQAMLLVLSALYILLFKTGARSGRCLGAGLLLGAAAFWGIKYALFIYPIALGFIAYWLWHKRYRHAILLAVFPILFQALFFYYLYSSYGTFSPNAVYYGMLSPEQSGALLDTLLKKITLTERWETLLDYFFDQRDGLLPYNPFYFFAFPGLLLALKNFRRYRLQLLAALPALLFILNQAASTIRPGYCPQGRYLAPAAWMLLLFALIYYRESRGRFFRKAFLVLPCYSLFVTIYQTLEPFTLYQPTTHDSLLRTGLMFQKWSNTRIDLPAMLPSFIKADNHGYLPNSLVGIAFLLLAALSLVRIRPKEHRRHGSPAAILLFAGVFSLCCLFPRLDLSAPRQISGPRQLPCRIYFSPQPMADDGEARWIFSGQDRGRMLLETLVPLRSIELSIRSRSGQAPLDLTVGLFDERAARLLLPAGGLSRLTLNRPRFKKIKARHYYQFTWQGTAGQAWLLELGLQ